MDKSSWGEGPWANEPDHVEFEVEGFPCIAHRAEITGSWCGYVAVPPGHPWHGQGYGAIDTANVHGGLTYSAKCSERVCHVPKPGESDDVWWLGFDCGHGCDFSPAIYALVKGITPDSECSYKDLQYITSEIKVLAKEAKEVMSNAT